MNSIFSINPSNGNEFGPFQLVTGPEIQRFAYELKEEQKNWSNIPVGNRIKFVKNLSKSLRENKEHLTRLLAEEIGRPVKLGGSEIDKCIALCEYYCKNAESFLKPIKISSEYKKSFVSFEPLGNVLVISPWNYPFWLALRPTIPALIAGNTVLLKHSSSAPRCATALMQIIKKSGLDEICKIVLAESTNISAVIDSDLVEGIAFIGGSDTGSIIGSIAGKNIKKSLLELGGSDPFIILEDADIEQAAIEGIESRMFNSGQNCDSAKRFIVVESVAREFEQKLMEKTLVLKVGSPLSIETDIGPLISESAVLTMENLVKDAVSKGARILCGGKKIDRPGLFFLPTILTGVTKDMRVFREEVFGPIAPIIVVKNAIEAIQVANDSQYGLGASIWTKNAKRGELLARNIQAGTVCVNHKVRSDVRFPFGGIKNSGYGRELGPWGIREFVNVKSIIVEK